jgi:hypothetical protein
MIESGENLDHITAKTVIWAGGITASSHGQTLAGRTKEYFDTTPWAHDWNPRFNIAPTQPVPVIRQHPKESVSSPRPLRSA